MIIPPSDTFFTASPEWGWYVVFYFFFGGIAGGSYFLSAFLGAFGGPEDKPLARLGHYIAFAAVLLCAPLLIIDLNRPERFWHMILQSETFLPMFKYWSPMSVGSWALLLFGAFAFVSFVGALIESGRLKIKLPGFVIAIAENNIIRQLFTITGALVGFFLASYTGVLLAVTNRPIWADTTLLGLLFLTSAASTAAALLLLISYRRQRYTLSVEWLSRLDDWVTIIEILVLVAFLASIGAVISVFWSIWGVLLIFGALLVGMILPLTLRLMPRLLGNQSVPIAAVFALVGGFILRTVIVFSSQVVAH